MEKQIVFQIKPEFSKELENFLNEQPYEITNIVLEQMFDQKTAIPDKMPFYTQEGINMLIDCLKLLPRKKSKNFLDNLKTNLIPYEASQNDNKEEK
jgi:hypothetical protein